MLQLFLFEIKSLIKITQLNRCEEILDKYIMNGCNITIIIKTIIMPVIIIPLFLEYII